MSTRARFAVTYEIITPESAEAGDYAEAGYIAEAATLRDAIADLYRTRTRECDSGQGLEVNDFFACYMNGMEYRTGAHETRAIHWPMTLTPASRARVVRLIQKGSR